MIQNLKIPMVAALLAASTIGIPAYAVEGTGLNATPNPAASALPAAPEKTRTVTGTVTDAVDGEPLVGATVMVQGETTGTVTDIDGNFSITVKVGKKTPTLVVSYIGYQKGIVPVENMADLKITLRPEANSLEDVVVVGTGTQKKVSVTGAISSVSGGALKTSASTLTNNLAGKFAGVYANNTSGKPGDGASFYIRGIDNFASKSATPLILLDDVEISAGDLNYIPAENIASFSVLKDASATAIYGARGANGVMIVTTKGGDYNSKTKVNISVENAFNILDDMPQFVDGATFMETYNKAQYYRTPLVAPVYSQEQIDRTRSGKNPYLYPDVNWEKTLFKKMALRQRVNLNVSGGGNKVKYYMSVEMNHENGHYRTAKLFSWNNNIQNYNYTFQNNISYKLTPTTTVSMNLNAQIRQKVSPNVDSGQLFGYVHGYNPVMFPVMYPARDGYDHHLFGSFDYTATYFFDNPYAVMNSSFAQSNANTTNTVIKVDQDLAFITKGLKLNVWVNFKNWSQKSFNRSVTPYKYRAETSAMDAEDWENPIFDLRKLADGTNYITESAQSNTSDNTFELQGNLSYSRRFGESEVNANAIYRMREYRGTTVLPNRNQGISGRVTYDYAHKYLAEFNFGYNGTERLAKGYRFGFFPAGSLGWVVSNEKFWEPISNVVNHFKVRGSYGLVGSDDLVKANGAYFLYIDKLIGDSLNGLTWQPGAGGGAGWGQSLGGPRIQYIGVKDLGWEKVKKLDIGVDFRFFDDLSVTLDYFHSKRYNMFMERKSWPAMLGYGEMMPYAPIGEVENKGFEGSVSWSKNLNHETAITFTGNFTYNTNKILNMDELNYKYPWQFQTGLPVNHIRGYICDGLFRSQEEIDNSPVQNLGSKVMVGDLKYRDLNCDGQINQDDQTMISDTGTTPRFQYGFGATLNWRKFDFGFFFTGSAKRTIAISGLHPFQPGSGTAPRSVLNWIYENAFDPEKGNFDAEYPLMGIQSAEVSNNTVQSTYWLRKGDFLRLRNIELGWTFPYGRVYVQGVNLVNFTGFKLWDPELGAWNSYPLQKTVNIGVQFNL